MESILTSQRKVLGRMGHQYKTWMAVLIITSFLWGCGAKHNDVSFVRPETDFGYINKIAVLTFGNVTKSEDIGKTARNITMTQILAMGKFDAVDLGVVDSALHDMAIDRDAAIDSPVLKRLGQRLGVQAFMHGTVESISLGQAGSYIYPEVALTLKLIDSETSVVLWQSSAHRNGYSLTDRLFGLDPKDEYELMVDLTAELLSTIPK